MREVHAYAIEKFHYWGMYSNLAARVTKKKFPGRRSCVDPFSSYGVNYEKEANQLRWGSALLALQVQDPFDVYIFGDRSEEASDVLAARAEALGIYGAEIFRVDFARDPSLGRTITAIKGASPPGPKVVIYSGDANDASPYIKQLLPAWAGVRYTLAMFDPCSASYDWDALSMLVMDERSFDFLMLFADGMDIKRNLNHYRSSAEAGAKLNRYFGTTGWREVAAVHARPAQVALALRDLYTDRLRREHNLLIGDEKQVRNRRQAELYRLIFASKHQLGIDLWNKANRRNAYGQDQLYLGPGI